MRKPLLLFFLPFVFLKSFQAQNNDGDSLFNNPIVHDVYLNFSQTGYWDSLTANYTADVYMKCDVTVDGRLLPNTGVKFKGNSSYNNPSNKKSWKLDFDEYNSTQDYNDLKKLNLNNCFKDPSLLREKVMLDYCAKAGITAPRCAYTRVYLNGTYWGLYTMVEEVNKDFLDDEFFDKKGNLFKGDPQGDLKWYGSSQSSYYTRYELKTNETQNDWSDLVHFIDEVNNSTTAQFNDSLEAVFHTQQFIKSWAASNLFVNLDSYIGSGHNYYVYHDSLTNKFNWIVWDVNEAFANFNMGMTVPQLEALSIYYINSPMNRPLCNKMLANANYKSQYTFELCSQVEDYFSNSYLDPLIDSLANKIRSAVYADTLKTFSNQNFEDNIVMDITIPGGPGSGGTFAGLKSFIADRRAAVLAELAANGCNVGVEENEYKVSLSVYPNPASDFISLKCNEPLWEVSLFSVDGKSAYNGEGGNTDIDTRSLSNGLYFVHVKTASGKMGMVKFIKQ